MNEAAQKVSKKFHADSRYEPGEKFWFEGFMLVVKARNKREDRQGCGACVGDKPVFNGENRCFELPHCSINDQGVGERFEFDMTDDATADKVALLRLRGEL